MTKLTLQLKRLGKKKIKTIDFELPYLPKTIKELICACVQAEVKKFNDKREAVKLAPFLSPAAIQSQSEEGKIGFGEITNLSKADEQQAIENALLSFTDGLFVIFINDMLQEDLKQKITLNENSEIAFMRMTFLSGTYW